MMHDAQVGTWNLQRSRALFREHVTRRSPRQCGEIDRERSASAGAQCHRLGIGFRSGRGVCLPFRPAVYHHFQVVQLAKHDGKLLERSGFGIGGTVAIHEDRGISSGGQAGAQR